MGAALAGGDTAVITCTSNLAANGAPGAVTFGIKTTTDLEILTGLTGYVVMPVAIVGWNAATRQVYRALTPGGWLKISFTPNSANMGWVMATASQRVFAADTTMAVLLSSGTTEITNQGVTSVSSAGTILTVNVAGITLRAGRVAVITCSANLQANPVTGTAITFSISTSTDTLNLAGQTGYTTTPQDRASWISASRSLSYVSGAHGGDLVVQFTATNALSATQTIAITPSANLFTGDGALNCTLSSNSATVSLVSSVVVSGVLTLTAGAAVTALELAVVTCTDHLAVNGAAGAITFAVQTTTDTSALTGQTGYTVAASNAVGWGSATRGGSFQLGLSGGTFQVKFTPTARVAPGGVVTVTGTQRIFVDTWRFHIPFDTTPPAIRLYVPVQGAGVFSMTI